MNARMPAAPVHRTGPGGNGSAVSPGCMVKKPVARLEGLATPVYELQPSHHIR